MMPQTLLKLRAHRMWRPVMHALLATAYVAIVAASLAPKQMRPTSGVLPGAIEHLAAYFMLGALGAAILRHRISWWTLALCNGALAGTLELAQLLVPGRVANAIDFAASALGSLLGILAICALHRGLMR